MFIKLGCLRLKSRLRGLKRIRREKRTGRILLKKVTLYRIRAARVLKSTSKKR